MKTPVKSFIAEFEVIAPANDSDKVGEIFYLSAFGDYCPRGNSRAYNLLYLLDHPLHYRVSKITMNGTNYIIPADREKNYAPKFHPDTMKYYLGDEPDRKPNT